MKADIDLINFITHETRWEILEAMGDDHVSIATIAQRMGIKPQNVLHHLNALVERGLVKFYTDPEKANRKLFRRMSFFGEIVINYDGEPFGVTTAVEDTQPEFINNKPGV